MAYSRRCSVKCAAVVRGVVMTCPRECVTEAMNKLEERLQAVDLSEYTPACLENFLEARDRLAVRLELVNREARGR